MPSSNPPAAHVAKEVISKFDGRLQDQAVCLTTPVPKLVPMSKVKLSPTLRVLIDACEPRSRRLDCMPIRRRSSARSQGLERSARIG